MTQSVSLGLKNGPRDDKETVIFTTEEPSHIPLVKMKGENPGR
jgi:hypothetical protein